MVPFIVVPSDFWEDYAENPDLALKKHAIFEPVGDKFWNWVNSGLSRITGGLTSLILSAVNGVVMALPQPLQFLVKNIGWILLGLLVMTVLGFLWKFEIL